jgi:hypothetical protein
MSGSTSSGRGPNCEADVMGQEETPALHKWLRSALAPRSHQTDSDELGDDPADDAATAACQSHRWQIMWPGFRTTCSG